jgi:transmembrane sensor
MNTAWRKAIKDTNEALGYPESRDVMEAYDDPAWQKALTEASSWIVLMHGSQRTPAAERGLQLWLGDSEINRAAMEHATNTWNDARAAVRGAAKIDVSVPEPPAQKHARGGVARAVWAAAAAVLVVMIGSLAYYFQASDLATDIGETRTVALEDGTQVILNTNTRISVHYNTQQRHVALLSGEAFFKVARRPDWPFVVSAGDREVTALGTSFLVRRDPERLAVTLVEGKVAVNAAAQSVSEKAIASAPLLVLTPGERLTYNVDTQKAKLDRPAIERITAWQQGFVNIDDMTLAEAVEEMNRYSKLKLFVEGPATEVRVGGVFRVTDARTLARAVALTHGLSMHEEDGRVVLSGTPRPATEESFDNDQQEKAELH